MRLHIREIEFSLPGTGAVVVTGQLDICPSRFAYWFGARRRTLSFSGIITERGVPILGTHLYRARVVKWLSHAVMLRAFDWLVKQREHASEPLGNDPLGNIVRIDKALIEAFDIPTPCDMALSVEAIIARIEECGAYRTLGIDAVRAAEAHDKDTLARIDDALTDVLGIRTPGEPPLQITTETVIARIKACGEVMDARDAKIAEYDAMLAVVYNALRRHQWYGSPSGSCHECSGRWNEDEGHKEDCPYAALLARLKKLCVATDTDPANMLYHCDDCECEVDVWHELNDVVRCMQCAGLAIKEMPAKP